MQAGVGVCELPDLLGQVTQGPKHSNFALSAPGQVAAAPVALASHAQLRSLVWHLHCERESVCRATQRRRQLAGWLADYPAHLSWLQEPISRVWCTRIKASHQAHAVRRVNRQAKRGSHAVHSPNSKPLPAG